MDWYRQYMIAMLLVCAVACLPITGAPSVFVALAGAFYLRTNYEAREMQKTKGDLFEPPTAQEAYDEFVHHLRTHVRPVFEMSSPEFKRLVEQVTELTEASVYQKRKSKD